MLVQEDNCRHASSPMQLSHSEQCSRHLIYFLYITLKYHWKLYKGVYCQFFFAIKLSNFEAWHNFCNCHTICNCLHSSLLNMLTAVITFLWDCSCWLFLIVWRKLEMKKKSIKPYNLKFCQSKLFACNWKWLASP